MAKAAALLQVNETRADFLSRRLDSLLTRGQVVAVGPQLRVAHEVKHELENAERVYLSELHLLAERQRQFLETTFQLSWSQEDALMASSLIARAFIQRQLATTRDARVALTALGLTKHIGDPLQLLREYLAEKGVHRGSVESVLSEFMEQAKDLPIVQKLTRAAVFVAIEGADPVSAAKAIGAARWVDVKVMLDASVAIPCLCAKIYRPTSNRFSLLSERAVATLAGLGAQVCTLVGYLNECASHLLRAVEYDRLDRFDSALRYSTNAYVSAYYQLRADGADLPDSLVDFLAYFAPSCKVPSGDKALWIRKVMAEIQPKFARYRIAVEEAGAIGPEYTRDIENAYVHGLRDAGRQKHSMLIDHDVVALGYVRRQIAKAGQSWILLTWDRHVMRAGEEFQDCGWVVSPDVAADFAQPSRAVSESGLCALAHAIARTRDRPLEIAARMIDRVVAIAGARMQDWQFQKELDDFRKGLLQRMDLNAADYDEWVDWETDRFLAEAGHEGEATAKEQR